MKIILHGKLRKMFGPEYEIGTDTAADAIEGLSRQLPEWPRDMLIDVVDFETKEKLQTKTKVSEIHLVPALVGGGAVGKIILGAALIALAIINPLGFSTIVASVILSIGVSLALSGIMQLFYKAPTLNKSDDPPESKYLGNNGNTTKIGTYRNIAYGRTKVFGHWLSMQVDERSIVLGRFPSTPPA